MWNKLYGLWRSVLRRAPRVGRPTDPQDRGPRNALREELQRLLEERSRLVSTIASYQEFGYDELAERAREDLAAADRRIRALRIELHRPPRAPGRSG
jgi:hypothetical protein